MQLLGGDGDLAAGHLDPDLVGMGGQVVVPRRIPRRSGRRGDDQPAVVLAGEPADRRLALDAALAADCGQDQGVEPQAGHLALAAYPVDGSLRHPPADRATCAGLTAAASSIACRCVEAHATCSSTNACLSVKNPAWWPPWQPILRRRISRCTTSVLSAPSSRCAGE